MKKLLFYLLFLGMGIPLLAQIPDGLPDNPDPNKCYVRCVTPDVYETRNVDVIVNPGYKKLTVVPAEYETVYDTIIIKEGYVRYEVDPPTFKKVAEEYTEEDACATVKVIPPEIVDGEEEVEVVPAIARWEYQPYEGCKSDDPLDCQVLCWREYPPKTEVIPVKRVAKDATYEMVPGTPKMASFTKEVIDRPAQVREIRVPPVVDVVRRKVKVKDETVKEEIVGREVINLEKEVLVEKGGLTVWEEIDCELLEYSVLPINYEFGSARLTPEAREIIEDRLVTLMKERPNIKIEISSHTDSRGSDEANQNLSERRAQSVVNYLMDRGINASRLVARGFGEARLKNRCADDVPCTEAEHAVNRRTEFRVLNY